MPWWALPFRFGAPVNILTGQCSVRRVLNDHPMPAESGIGFKTRCSVMGPEPAFVILAESRSLCDGRGRDLFRQNALPVRRGDDPSGSIDQKNPGSGAFVVMKPNAIDDGLSLLLPVEWAASTPSTSPFSSPLRRMAVL